MRQRALLFLAVMKAKTKVFAFNKQSKLLPELWLKASSIGEEPENATNKDVHLENSTKVPF